MTFKIRLRRVFKGRHGEAGAEAFEPAAAR